MIRTIPFPEKRGWISRRWTHTGRVGLTFLCQTTSHIHTIHEHSNS